MQVEPELTWNRERQLFLARSIDPKNGIETIWEKDPKSRISVCINRLPRGSSKTAYRRFSIFPRSDGPEEHEYRAIYLLGDNRSIEISARNIRSSETFDLSLVLDQLSETRDIHLLARYQPPGDLCFFSFSAQIVRKNDDKEGIKSKDIISMDIEKRWNYLHDQRALDENLKDVVKIFGTHGVSLFMPGDLPFHVYMNHVTKEVQEKQKTWPQSLKNDLSLAFLIMHHLEPFRLELPSAEMAQLTMCLLMEVSKNLPTNLPSLEPEQQDLLVIDQFKDTVAGILSTHYSDLEEAANYDAYFSFSQPASRQFQVRIENIMKGQIFQTTDVGIGEAYRYGEYVYQVTEPREGILTLSSKRLITPRLNISAQFPRTVPLDRLSHFLSSEGNSGWEQAMDLIPCKLQVIE